MPVDLPIPRFYDSGPGNQRADPNKPDDLRAREAAQANAFETACNAQTGPDKWAACADLGRAYHLGEGRPQNRPVAELLCRRACNAGSGAGCYGLGTLLESVNEENEVRLASQYFARACQLGMLNGCDKQADGLAEGSFFDPDPQAAETLRRATCDRGGRAACIAVAGLLLRQDRTSAEQDEGRALLDRQCRSGDPVACRDAAAHWQRLIMPDAGARYIEYLALGCDAGDPALCRDRGRTELPYYDISDAAQFVPAQRFFDRACALDDYYCKSADMLRDVPQISTKCDAGDQPSCLALGLMLVQGDSPIRDDTRALALLGPQCDAGANAACLPAANLVIEQWRTNNIPNPVRLDAFLRRSCASGERSACEVLANILARGDLLEQDTTGAAVLYVDICENSYFFDQACDFLEELARNDPAAPLTLAKADYVPEPTPEEIAEAAEQERLENEKRLREIEEEFARACTTTTVIFEGQSYTDKLCTSVVRVVNGFAARVGEAPWQALLWRPEKLSRKLTLAERVKCGGAVIRDGWILTAAHCLTDDGGVSITTAGHRVRLGLNNPLSDEGYSYPIIRAIPHPDFKRKPLAFDIALVQYDTARGERGGGKVMPPRRIRLDPLLLDQRKLSAVQRVVTYGWGETKVDTGLVPDHLRGARLKLRSTDACTADTRFEDDKRRDSLICADDTKAAEGGQACSGDSGGPLITYGDADSVPTVIGVVSGGVECGTSAEGRPSRYTRIAHPLIRAWLRSHVPGFGLR
jgi:TPR repeat protein